MVQFQASKSKTSLPPSKRGATFFNIAQFVINQQEKEEALNAKIMSSKLLDKKLKGLEQENQRLLEALKAFGRRSANNATYLPGAGGVAHSSGVVGGGVFGGVNAAPLGISRPFRTVTPLNRKLPEMNQLSVETGNGTLCFVWWLCLVWRLLVFKTTF